MKFAVTYCVLDQQVGSNPFWHSCLLLSRLDEPEGKMEITDQWGFYGVPTTGSRDSFLGKLKIKVGLDLDLQGNHGMLRHEEVRFLDAGCGLHGQTFELTEDKFKLLQQKCADMATNQEKAIREIVEPLALKGKPPEETRIYPHEQFSTHIFTLEKIRAQQEGRLPRLKPFELNLSMSFWGPNLNQSHTCKSQVLSLLDGILTEEQINRLTENGKHKAVPRYSGSMESIFLHSSGPLSTHKKHSGQEVYYRDGNNPDVKLYWTLPPQEVEFLSEDTRNLLKLPEEYCAEVKSVVSKLQRLEWLFINAELSPCYEDYRKNLIARIREHYEAFANVTPKKAQSKISGWLGYAWSLLSIPRDLDEESLLQKVRKAKILLNSLYMAVVDNFEIDLNLTSELQDNGSATEETYYNPLEAVAAYLKTEDKQQLCSLLGRSYLEPETTTENNLGSMTTM
ncbi:hypothetical protein [Legionella brunensis]|uniref:Uncharacterized protein n=1 Tax=Legionella brunensis TaxID=29422 RepID=A0A0W0SU11_9GAMM|nr:hypothetical protein [Legionella brunensis]KTC86875.1 hypothetical protein Lbru_0104 [Legionella brunensis]